MKRFEPISQKLPKFLHGGDYNPEQWMNHPEVIEEDIRLMKEAHCNAMSIGIFSWVTLEPKEGKFDFEWLDKIINKLYENGIYTILATPSGARPAWMSLKYEEVLRVNEMGIRNLHGARHNHCYTSPVYREKTRIINTKLAERYSNHPGVIAWHISNEYGGECHCELCQSAFRKWLKAKYKTLEALNEAWWTNFWSHTYTDWEQIHSPVSRGEMCIHGLTLDWKRFVTAQTVDFMKEEAKPLKAINPELPVVINMMGTYDGLDYWQFKDAVDVIAWDNYPAWHKDPKDDVNEAVKTAMIHDLNRSLKDGKPFMLMESTPSQTNWQEVCKPKKPGMHLLSSLQAVAHGSDTVQYFQWRKSRGSVEKFHGAVVGHSGGSKTRVFKEVTSVGESLEKIQEVLGTSVSADVAIIFDWENRWALDNAQALRNGKMHYEESVIRHYKAFWKKGVPVDIINEDCEKYKVIVAPMLYMLRKGVAEKIEQFVKNGGKFITTYWSGIVEETDLCFLDGGPLRKVLGIWSEELDPLYDYEKNSIIFTEGQNITGEYEAVEVCDIIHAETAKVLATYGSDYYANMPALTVNQYGKGEAYYIATKCQDDFYDTFYEKIISHNKIKHTLNELPYGVSSQLREGEEADYIFVMNFTKENKEVSLNQGSYTDLLTNEVLKDQIVLEPYGVSILKQLH